MLGGGGGGCSGGGGRTGVRGIGSGGSGRKGRVDRAGEGGGGKGSMTIGGNKFGDVTKCSSIRVPRACALCGARRAGATNRSPKEENTFCVWSLMVGMTVVVMLIGRLGGGAVGD